MAIGSYNEDEFQEILYAHLSPSEPISSVQLLKGRTKTLQQIRQALLSPGRHVFIFGDRGVGKTSLAQTAAALHQSADGEAIILSCGSPFLPLARDLAHECANPSYSDSALISLTPSEAARPFASSPVISSITLPLRHRRSAAGRGRQAPLRPAPCASCAAGRGRG